MEDQIIEQENNLTPAPETEGTPEGMKEKDIKSVAKRQRVIRILVKVGLYLFLTIMAIIVIFPFYWMLISSVKTVDEYNNSATLWPSEFVWANYTRAFMTFTCRSCKHEFYSLSRPTVCPICGLTAAAGSAEQVTAFADAGLNLGQLFLNTVLVGVVSTLLSLVITVLAAYAFARLDFKGKGVLFALLLATMMIPGELFTVTNYTTVSNFGWISNTTNPSDMQKFNAFLSLVIPFLVSVFYIYLLRQNFMQIPNELYLAAKVDGTSDLKYLWKVMIPLSAPTLVSITILKMMGAWNSYIWPRLVAKNSFTLVTVGLRGATFTDPITEMTNYPAQMAAVLIVTIPLLLVFIFFRKYIMRGVSHSGLKG